MTIHGYHNPGLFFYEIKSDKIGANDLFACSYEVTTALEHQAKRRDGGSSSIIGLMVTGRI